MHCQTCGNLLPANAKFCTSCGASVASSVRPAPETAAAATTALAEAPLQPAVIELEAVPVSAAPGAQPITVSDPAVIAPSPSEAAAVKRVASWQRWICALGYVLVAFYAFAPWFYLEFLGNSLSLSLFDVFQATQGMAESANQQFLGISLTSLFQMLGLSENLSEDIEGIGFTALGILIVLCGACLWGIVKNLSSKSESCRVAGFVVCFLVGAFVKTSVFDQYGGFIYSLDGFWDAMGYCLIFFVLGIVFNLIKHFKSA